MIMKITITVKDKGGNIVHKEDFFIKEKSQILQISEKVSDKIVELEGRYPYPEYEIEQNLSWVDQEV
ncbi:MAG: hypothetical protein ABDH21_06465 [bacterium]